MKVKLLKDLEMYGVRHLAGEEVEVPEEVYNYLMQSIIADRIIEITTLQKEEKKVRVK